MTELSSRDRKLLDRKLLERFLTSFSLRSVQVIVQARLGAKTCTRSSPSPGGSDSFDLAMRDLPEVTHEAKRALAGSLHSSVCVEISLKTSEGDSTELETWRVDVNGDEREEDASDKACDSAYSRLSLLLRSLLTITRVLPAYKLSRRQGHHYVLFYRVYLGQVAGLGGPVVAGEEGFQTVRVGVVGTAMGTVALSCSYRSAQCLSNRPFQHPPPAMPISVDHFRDRSDGNVRLFPDDPHGGRLLPNDPGRPFHCRAPEGEGFALLSQSQEVCAGGAAELCPTPGAVDPRQQTLLHAGMQGGVVTSAPVRNDLLTVRNPPGFSGCNVGPSHGAERRDEGCGRKRMSAPSPSLVDRPHGALVDRPHTQVAAARLDVPFSAFTLTGGLEDEDEDDPMIQPPDSLEVPSSPLRASLRLQHSQSSGQPPQPASRGSSYFKPAFSRAELLLPTTTMDVGSPYGQLLLSAPPPQLAPGRRQASMADALACVPEQLAVYQRDMERFDAFVDTLLQ